MNRKTLTSLNEAALQVQNEELRRPPIPSWDEIAGRAAKRSAKEKPESDKSKQKRWDKAGLNMHNISSTDPNYVHRNNPKFDPRNIPKKKKKNESIELDLPDMVLEYFNGYFGDNLNEDTSDEDIMNAVYDLVDLTEAVCEAIGLDEGIWKDTKELVKDIIRNPRMKAPKEGDADFQPLIKKKPKKKLKDHV